MMQDRTREKAQKTANYDENMARFITNTLTLPIVMIGMMGAGKTHTGKALATALSLPFIDNDQEIERTCGCTIADYFTHKGEESFRALEHKTLKALIEGKPKVIAAGGGIVIHPDTRALLKNKAYAVWLQADPSILAARCAGDHARPLLQGGDPRIILEQLLEKRRNWYAETAAITVRSDAGDISTSIEAILSSLNSLLKHS